MEPKTISEATAVSAGLSLSGPVCSVEPMGAGRINDTFLVRYGPDGGERGVVLQRINPGVFPHPEWIVENMLALQQHLNRRTDAEGFVFPALVPWKDGAVIWTDPSGSAWRGTEWIREGETRAKPRSPEDTGEVGRILGRFHVLTADMAAGEMRDTLPGYHVAPNSLARLDNTFRMARDGRCPERFFAEGVSAMIGFVEERRCVVPLLENARRSGRLVERVTHGDPKMDNVLMHRRWDVGIGLIDYDTLKPGLLPCDFGDAARSVCNPAGEEAEPEAVCFDMDAFDAFATRYLKEVAKVLSSGEANMLFDAVRVLTLDLGIRFLEDYLAGDRYFPVRTPDCNRRRAMVQFSLCAELERKEPIARVVILDAFRANATGKGGVSRP